MRPTEEYLQKRLETCRRLFFEYKGREHSRIEREMRSLGFADFNRRCLYPRGIRSGWIERYGWDRELLSKEPAADNSKESINEFHEWIKRVSPPTPVSLRPHSAGQLSSRGSSVDVNSKGASVGAVWGRRLRRFSSRNRLNSSDLFLGTLSVCHFDERRCFASRTIWPM